MQPQDPSLQPSLGGPAPMPPVPQPQTQQPAPMPPADGAFPPQTAPSPAPMPGPGQPAAGVGQPFSPVPQAPEPGGYMAQPQPAQPGVPPAVPVPPSPMGVMPDAAVPPTPPGQVTGGGPESPVPGSPMAGSPTYNTAGGSGKLGGKKRLAIVGVVVVLLIAVAAALTVVVMNMLATIKLKPYDATKYSIQIPADYKKETSGDTTKFIENDKEKTQSQVIVYYADFPAGAVSEDQVSSLKETLRSQLKTAAGDLATSSDTKVEDLKVVDTTFNGVPALVLTAAVTSNGKSAGKVKVIAVVNTKQLYMVGVAAHNSDKGLQKKMDTVINSFKLK